MKALVTIITFAITFICLLNVAVAKTTSSDLRKYEIYSQAELHKSLFEIQKALQDFELSKSLEADREKEALMYLELSYKLLSSDGKTPAIDDTGDTDTFLYQKYNSDQKTFSKALLSMPPAKIKALRQAMSEVADALNNGQDKGIK